MRSILDILVLHLHLWYNVYADLAVGLGRDVVCCYLRRLAVQLFNRDCILLLLKHAVQPVLWVESSNRNTLYCNVNRRLSLHDFVLCWGVNWGEDLMRLGLWEFSVVLLLRSCDLHWFFHNLRCSY